MYARRVLLKLSGELLGSNQDSNYQGGFDPNSLSLIAQAIKTVVEAGIQVAIVVGGGNWFRGATKSQLNIERVTADQVGMLATLMNAVVLGETLAKLGSDVKVLSSISMPMLELFEWKSARQHLDNGRIVVLGGGTGHPFVSTDSAASLRALEINADILLKATTVDGVYSADPKEYVNAKLYTHISYDQVIQDELKVMDLAAFMQCREYKLPIRVFHARHISSLLAIINGETIGTLVSD